MNFLNEFDLCLFHSLDSNLDRIMILRVLILFIVATLSLMIIGVIIIAVSSLGVCFRVLFSLSVFSVSSEGFPFRVAWCSG